MWSKTPETMPIPPVFEPLEDRLLLAGGILQTLAVFNGTNGANSRASLVMDAGGNLYGTTSNGGASGYGTVFEWVKSLGTITVLASFNNTNGAHPSAGLIMDGSGNLYGTAYSGGASNGGTVFEVVKGSGAITVLGSFTTATGGYPYAGLVMDGTGNLYGTTYGGGASSYGTVFEWVKSTGTIHALASFNGANGANPLAGLIIDGAGNLYGTAWHGGANNDGTVFEVGNGSGAITVLASFNGTNGAQSPGQPDHG